MEVKCVCIDPRNKPTKHVQRVQNHPLLHTKKIEKLSTNLPLICIDLYFGPTQSIATTSTVHLKQHSSTRQNSFVLQKYLNFYIQFKAKFQSVKFSCLHVALVEIFGFNCFYYLQREF